MTQVKTRAKINKKRWAAYATAGVAATLAGAQSAEADITHVVVGSPAGDINVGDDKYFFMTGSASVNVFNSAVPPGGVGAVGIYNSTVGFLGTLVGFTSAGFNYASNLASGVNISTQNFLGTSQFATLAYGNGYGGDQFLNTSGFIAFRFNGGGGIHFGWMRLTANNDAPNNTYVVEEYAFGDAGEAVAVGQTTAIPEPSSLGLLALGAVGVLAARRRRKNNPQNEEN